MGLKEHGIRSRAFGFLGFLYLTLCVAFGESRLSLGLSVPVCKKRPAVPTLHSSPGLRLLGYWGGGVVASLGCDPCSPSPTLSSDMIRILITTLWTLGLVGKARVFGGGWVGGGRDEEIGQSSHSHHGD